MGGITSRREAFPMCERRSVAAILDGNGLLELVEAACALNSGQEKHMKRERTQYEHHKVDAHRSMTTA